MKGNRMVGYLEDKKKKTAIIVAILILSVSVLFKLAIFDNVKILCKIAVQFGEPSTIKYLALERIYKISEKENLSEMFLKKLNESKKQDYINLYIRVLGVLGEENTIPYLMQTYSKYQNNNNFRSTIYYTIVSMGLIGSKRVVPILEALFNNYKMYDVVVSESLLSHTLYLLTGNSDYYFTNSSGERQKLYLSKEEIQARKIIADTKGRKRTFKEMMQLEKIYRT